MIIRTLIENDVKEFKYLRLKSLQEDPDSFLRTYEEEANRPIDFYINRFKQEWSSPDNFVLGLFSDEKLLGYVGFRREDREKVRHKGVLWGMYVIPEVRGEGKASILLEELIKRIKLIEGIEQINLIVAHTNDSAKRLYKKFGFELYGTEKRAIKINNRYLDEDYMVLIFDKNK